MPNVSLAIVNFFSGNGGSSSGSSIFTDLSGKFVPSVVGSSLEVGGISYPIAKMLASTSLQVSGTIPAGTGLSWSISSSIVNGQTVIVNESPTHGYIMAFEATGTETSPQLATKNVTLDFDFGTGLAPSTVSDIGSVSGSYSLRYAPGTYRVVATASNRKYPTPQSKSIFFTLKVVGNSLTSNATVPFAVIGPVLPSDGGYPDAEEWNLNLDVDDRVITSNVKMLLSTAIGERLMNPTYGTNIRSAIFDMDPDSIQTFLQSEITNAFSSFEPRAQLVGFTFDLSPTTRSATLNLQVRSLITRAVLPTPVTLNG